MKKYLVFVFVVGCIEALDFKGDACIGCVNAVNETEALLKAIDLAKMRGIDSDTVYVELQDTHYNETPWGESHSAF